MLAHHAFAAGHARPVGSNEELKPVDEHLRRQVTWLVVAGAVLCLIIYAGGRRSEVNRLRDQIAYGSPAQRLAAVERLVARR